MTRCAWSTRLCGSTWACRERSSGLAHCSQAAPKGILVCFQSLISLLVRGRPRDLYDVWLLLNQGVPLEPALIARKLMLVGMTLDSEAIEQAINRARADWERDLKPLLPQYRPCKDVEPVVTALRF